MKRLVVIFALALLLPASKSEAAYCVHYYHHYHIGPRPAVVCGVYHRAWVPGYWQWDLRYHRYSWIRGYWY